MSVFSEGWIDWEDEEREWEYDERVEWNVL